MLEDFGGRIGQAWRETDMESTLLEAIAADLLDGQHQVVAGGGKDRVVGIAATESEIVATHAVLGFEMADNGLDGGPAAQFTLDLGRHPLLLCSCAEMKTLTLKSGSALWLRIPCRRGRAQQRC